MKYETAGIGITEFVGLKLEMYSFLEDDNNKHNKEKE